MQINANFHTFFQQNDFKSKFDLCLLTLLSAPNLFISKLAVRTVFCAFITCIFNTAYAQENITDHLPVESKRASLSESDLLTKAKSFRSTEPQISIELAKEALKLSIDKNNQLIIAQAHVLLGELSQQAQITKKAQHHFLQASIAYQNINDKRNQIMSSLDYVALLYFEKRYDEGDKVINEILPIAHQYGDELPIAETIIVQSDSFYERKRYEDAIEQYSNALKYLSAQEENIQKRLALTHHNIAQANKQLRNHTQAIIQYKNALAIYQKFQDRIATARTLNNLAREERDLKNYISALDYSFRALEIQETLDDPEGLAKTLMGAGMIYRYLGRYEESLNHIYKAHLYFKKVNNISGMVDTSNQMGLIYTRLKQFDQARSFYQLTIDQPTDKILKKNLATALREMAVIDLKSSNYQSAIAMADKAHKIYIGQNDSYKSSLTARIIGDIYRAQKDKKKAITWYRESLSFAKRANSENYQIKAQTRLAGVLIGIDTDEAISLLESSLALSTKVNTKAEMLYAYRALKKAEKSLENYAKSLSYAEKEISLTKIIQKEKDKNKLILAKANLDSRKMEMELVTLKEKARLNQLELIKKNSEIEIAAQASQISELELTKNKYANIALAFLLLTCLILVFYIYRRFVASRERNKELDYLAARDPLTNCYNRRTLFDLMNRDFADLGQLEHYSLIMLDIDHFKAVNDTHGHSAGDSVLRGVANILQSAVRQNDITARYGGEEFCIVLPGAAKEQALRISENIRKKIEESCFDDIKVTCSFGVSSIKFNAKAPTELIDQADLALYKSKANGRNKVTLWNNTLGQE